MAIKLIDVSSIVSFPAPVDLTPEEEAAVIAQYKAERALEDLEAEYSDFDKQAAEGVPAEQLLKELREMKSDE